MVPDRLLLSSSPREFSAAVLRCRAAHKVPLLWNKIGVSKLLPLATIVRTVAPGLLEEPDDPEVDEEDVARAAEDGEDPEVETAEPVHISQALALFSSR